jgi:hypothetical protein
MLDRGSVEEEDVVVLALASSLGPPRVAEQVANIGDPGEVASRYTLTVEGVSRMKGRRRPTRCRSSALSLAVISSTAGSARLRNGDAQLGDLMYHEGGMRE